jgi:hypothetical protein
LLPWGLSWLPLGHHWSLQNCVTVVEFTYLGPFCHPPDPSGASCPPLGSSCPPFASLWGPSGHFWGPPGHVCDPAARLWFPFETLLDLIAPPLGPAWASLPPLWVPPGSLCPPCDTPGALWLTVGPLMRRFPHPAPVDTVEQSRNHRSASFSALQTHVCQKQNTFQPNLFDIIPGFVSTTNLHAPPPGGSTAIFLCKVAYGGKYLYNFGISLGSFWDHFELTCR